MPLSQIATFDFKQEYPLVWRRQRVPTLTVLADVPPDVAPATAVAALAPGHRQARPGACPRTTASLVGGTEEESANSQASVFAKVPLMLLLMLFFLMAQLHSFSRLFLVRQRHPAWA